jgi:hypothetical protein
VRVSDGKVSMSLSEKADGGAYTYLDMKDGKHVSFDVSGTKTKSVGYRSTETTGRLDGVTLHTTSGDVTPGEPVIVIVELTVQRLFQQNDIFGLLTRRHRIAEALRAAHARRVGSRGLCAFRGSTFCAVR